MFQSGDLKFGVVNCHEGRRYPETVRWAARRGAHVVFHPQFHEAGSYIPSGYADPQNSFHEKAVLCRAAENTCYFATVNYASAGSPTTSAVASLTELCSLTNPTDRKDSCTQTSISPPPRACSPPATNPQAKLIKTFVPQRRKGAKRCRVSGGFLCLCAFAGETTHLRQCLGTRHHTQTLNSESSAYLNNWRSVWNGSKL